MTKEEAIKYLQQLYPNGGHCWLDEQRIDAIDMAVRALQEEPVSEDLEQEIQRHLKDCLDVKFPTTDIASIKKDVEYTARHFAKWQQKQFEKNRLAHCDELTKEQAQIEPDFVTQHLKENSRTPTFIDAIEYGRNTVLTKLEKMVKDKEEKESGLRVCFLRSERTNRKTET